MSKRAARAPAFPHTLGRRAAIEGAGAAGAIAAIAVSAAPVRAEVGDPGTENERPPYSLPDRERVLRAHALEPLVGPALAALRSCESAGVTLVEAFAPRHGGLPFVVEVRPGHPHAGARRAFELMRHDASGQTPLARVGALALVIENRGDGARPTDEDDARLALRVAASLERHAAVLEALPLTTARERRRSAPFATLHVPLRPGDEAR